jgi:hypothetical protein
VTRESYEMDVAMLPIAKLPVFTCRIGTMEQGCNNEVVLIIPGPGRLGEIRRADPPRQSLA